MAKTGEKFEILWARGGLMTASKLQNLDIFIVAELFARKHQAILEMVSAYGWT